MEERTASFFLAADKINLCLGIPPHPLSNLGEKLKWCFKKFTYWLYMTRKHVFWRFGNLIVSRQLWAIILSMSLWHSSPKLLYNVYCIMYIAAWVVYRWFDQDTPGSQALLYICTLCTFRFFLTKELWREILHIWFLNSVNYCDFCWNLRMKCFINYILLTLSTDDVDITYVQIECCSCGFTYIMSAAPEVYLA